jgi:heat shock protein HslJ
MTNWKIISLLGLLCIFSFVSSAENNFNGKTYRVVEYTTRALTRLSKSLNLSISLNFGNNTVLMSGVCNSCNFRADYMGNNGVKFTPGICTLLACGDDKMKLENDVMSVLESANNIQINGNYLNISSPEKKLRLIEI